LVRVLGEAGVGHSIVGGSPEEQECSAGVRCAMSNVVSGFGGLVLVGSSSSVEPSRDAHSVFGITDYLLFYVIKPNNL